MIKPNARILKELQGYDSKLFVKWNNQESYFEVWRKMLWGDRLVCPVTQKMLGGGEDNIFAPLDDRILDWIHMADPFKKEQKLNWRWDKKRKYMAIERRQSERNLREYKNIGRDMYGLLNNEMINPDYTSDANFLKPDMNSKHKGRVSYRSAENAKEYFKDDSIRND